MSRLVLPSVSMALLLGLGCRDPEPIGEDPVITSMHGEPCDVAPGLPDFEHLGDACNLCLCEGGTWSCEDTTGACGMVLVDEVEAEVLVVVDDSSSMGPDRQARLARGMDALLRELDAHPYPVHLRVGITTTDLGNPACDPATADDGALRVRSCQEHLEDFAVPSGPTEEPVPDDAAARGCTDVCTLPQLRTRPTVIAGDATPRARPWLERYDGQTNIEGEASMSQALACAVPQGVAGCDFESPLQAALRALQRGADPGDPAAGFGTLGGMVHVLVVTDEADCSANEEWLTVFDPEGTRRFWSDPSADAPTSAVCWNAGVRCEGGPGTYDGCSAVNIDTAEHLDVPDDNAVLRPASDIMRHIATTTASEGTGMTLIGGVPQDEAPIEYADGDDPAFVLRYGIGPGCSTAQERAVPPVRMLEVADQVYSACADDYGPALAAAGRSILDWHYFNCFPSCAELEPECLVVAEIPGELGGLQRVSVPSCEGQAVPNGATLCFEARHGDSLPQQCADAGYDVDLVVRHDPNAVLPSDTQVLAWCRPSSQPEIDCPLLP